MWESSGHPAKNMCPCSADFDGLLSLAESNHGNNPPQDLSSSMKLFIRISLSLCAAVLSAAPASACCLFGGWWGAGYYGSPAYSAPSYSSYYGSPAYTSYYGGGYDASSGCCGTAAPEYSMSYGSCGSGCCATNCCDTCGSGCASGSCGSGSCAGTTPAGSLKPAQDPISDRKSPDYDDDSRSRRFNPDAASPRSPQADDPIDPVDARDRTDLFGRPKSGTDGGSGSGTFEEDKSDPALDRSLRKPPTTDPLDEKTLDPVETDPGKPVDDKTFLDDTSEPDNSASLRRDSVIARTSSLSEVIAPKRLASRSLPASHRPASVSKLAGNSDNSKSDSPRPLRWISAPLAEGHVQL